MSNTLLHNKQLKSVRISSFDTMIIHNPVEAMTITDLLISKEATGRLLLRFFDGNDEQELLFIDDVGIFNLSFSSGISSWKYATLEGINDSDGEVLITVGYLNTKGINKQNGGV